MEADISVPKLLASTGTRFSCSIAETRRNEKEARDRDNGEELAIPNRDETEGDDTNYFKCVQWYCLRRLYFLIPHFHQVLSGINI